MKKSLVICSGQFVWLSFVVQQTFLELQNKAALQRFSSTTEVDGKPNSPETPQDPK